MLTLQRLLANRVLEALEAREHVLVAPGAGDALVGEVEGVIAPTLPNIAPYLMQASGGLDEEAASFGDEDADEVVANLVARITEQLLESDHVDDIFSEDRLIRRDAFRAIRDILLRYIQGELEVEDDAPDDETHTLSLDRFGYVARLVSEQADPLILHDALARAGRVAGCPLVRHDIESGSASFHVADGSLLELEEAIAEQVYYLVEEEAVELPGIQQSLEVPAELARHPGFAAAIAEASARATDRSICLASCSLVGERTLLASVTPLGDDGARRADELFESYLGELEAALGALELAPRSARRPGNQQQHGAAKRTPRRGKR